VNVVALVPHTRLAAAPRGAWRSRLAAGDRIWVLALKGDDDGGADVEVLELDPRRTRLHAPAMSIVGRWSTLPAPVWRLILHAYWPELVWALRSFDPDVVDLRWAPPGAVHSARLRADLAPIPVVTRDADAARTPSGWRRYDPTAMVSIVLPVYNGARYLGQALETCLAQSHAQLEVVIVDDASTDATPEVIERFLRADRRVVALRNPSNLRLPGALNVGFARARGALLTWTSHDNYLDPTAIEGLVRYLHTWPDVDFVYSDYTRITAGGVPYVQRTYPPWRFRDWNVVGAYFLYRRAVYEATGDFRRELEFVEDYEYWVRVAKRFRLMRLHEPALYHYREHDESMSHRAGDVNPLRRHIWSEHF